MSEDKECAAAIIPLLNGHKGQKLYCKAPRVKGTLFCARHQHSMDRVYLGNVTASEYDYFRTDLDRFNN